jgi:microsomal epoxide hydrolase
VLAAQSSEGRAEIERFRIDVPDGVLRDLRERLDRVRYPDEFANAGWDYGTNLAYLKKLIAYWRNAFDWRAQERRLNQFDQFKTNIGGLKIHFVHQRSQHPNALPLLLLNGWPGSFDEFSKVIGPLTDPVRYGGRAEDAFHVVVPSMPGYGFSDKPMAPGYNNDRMVGVWAALMTRLGYARYGAHGTDWGGLVARRLAVADAPRVAGLHLTGCSESASPDSQGYGLIQGTKPQTLGYGLSDSPAGLAAWIVEKYYGWSDHAANVEEVYTKDELLTTIMIYWVTNTPTSSARLYYENRHPEGPQGRFVPDYDALFTSRVDVPTGCANFTRRYDAQLHAKRSNLTVPSRRPAAEQRYNIVRWTDMPRGGHFPALEQPQLWIDDVRAFFRERR